MDNKYASFDDLLGSSETEYADVTVDGRKYRIGSITGEDFVAWTELRDSGVENRKRASAVLIARSLVDANGARIGDEKKAEQLAKVKLKVSETMLRAIFKLNGINQKDEADAKKG